MISYNSMMIEEGGGGYIYITLSYHTSVDLCIDISSDIFYALWMCPNLFPRSVTKYQCHLDNFCPGYIFQVFAMLKYQMPMLTLNLIVTFRYDDSTPRSVVVNVIEIAFFSDILHFYLCTFHKFIDENLGQMNFSV